MIAHPVLIKHEHAGGVGQVNSGVGGTRAVGDVHADGGHEGAEEEVILFHGWVDC